MKKIFSRQYFFFLFSFTMAILIDALAFAQDSASSSSTTTTTTTEQTTTVQPWVWVVGGAILLLIIVALVRGNKSGGSHTDKVTYTKTTSTGDNS